LDGKEKSGGMKECLYWSVGVIDFYIQLPRDNRIGSLFGHDLPETWRWQYGDLLLAERKRK